MTRAPLVWLVIGLSSLTFFMISTQGLESLSAWFMPEALDDWFALTSIWRLWTPMFIHYTVLHWATNVYLWWSFASKLEAQSRIELLSVTLFTAAGGNFCQWWMQGPNFGGLSGVAYGLMAYLWLMNRYGARESYRIDNILASLMLCLIPLSFVELELQLASYAHLGGLAFGAFMAMATIDLKRRSQKVLR